MSILQNCNRISIDHDIESKSNEDDYLSFITDGNELIKIYIKNGINITIKNQSSLIKVNRVKNDVTKTLKMK